MQRMMMGISMSLFRLFCDCLHSTILYILSNYERRSVYSGNIIFPTDYKYNNYVHS